MKKLLLLFCALLSLGGSRAWAFDVTIASDANGELPTFYGSFSGQVFTTNAKSGLAGVTITADAGLTINGASFISTSYYGYCFKMSTAAAGTTYKVSLHAPDGYVITGYSVKANANTYSAVHTLTSADGSVTASVNVPNNNSPTGPKDFSVTGLSGQDTYFTISTASKANDLYIPTFTISLQAADPVNITYSMMYNNTSVATFSAANSKKGATPAIPGTAYRKYCTYSYYSDEECTSALTELPSSNATVYTKVTFNPPYTMSSSFDGATWYYLSFNRPTNKYVTMGSTTPYPTYTSKQSVSEALWAFTGDPYNGIKVMNARAGDGYYLKKTGISDKSAITMQKGGQSWTIWNNGSGFTLKDPDNLHVFVHDNASTLAVWNNINAVTNEGSALEVEPAEPIKVTYKLTYNGNVISSYTKDLYELVGATAAAPFDWELPNGYCSFGSCTPATITAETTEVTIPLVWNGPFDFSTDFASAVWYYMQINRDMWLSAGSTSEGVTSVVTGADLSTSDVALWAFIGNPCDGVKIINKSIGEGYYGQAGDPFNISSADENTLLTIVKDEKKGLMFKNSAGKYMELLIDNGVASVAFYYDTPYDGGNTNIITLRSYYCQKFIDDVYAWANANHRDEYFGPSEASLTALQNVIISMYPKMTNLEYSGFSIPNDILSNIVMKYPSTGYYRIKNNGTGDYLAYGQPAAPYVVKTPGLIAISSANVATDFSSIIKLTGSSGTYKLSTEGLNVQSQTTGNQAFPATSSEGANFEFTSANKNGIVSITNADSRVDDNNDGSLHNATGWTVNGVVNWRASASNSKWLIEDATTVTVPLTYISDNNASYATLYLPFGATITGAKAYILTVSGEWAIPSEITEIPANTGVLLRAEGNVASATVTINDDASAETTGNMLVGTNVDITAARSTGEYILGNGEDGLGFYQRKSGRKIGANKAYLQLNADLAVKGLLLNFDIATGIDGLTPDPSLSKKGEEIFNLAGQRMSRVQKGVNIVNGKKVLVK